MSLGIRHFVATIMLASCLCFTALQASAASSGSILKPNPQLQTSLQQLTGAWKNTTAADNMTVDIALKFKYEFLNYDLHALIKANKIQADLATDSSLSMFNTFTDSHVDAYLDYRNPDKITIYSNVSPIAAINTPEHNLWYKNSIDLIDKSLLEAYTEYKQATKNIDRPFMNGSIVSILQQDNGSTSTYYITYKYQILTDQGFETLLKESPNDKSATLLLNPEMRNLLTKQRTFIYQVQLNNKTNNLASIKLNLTPELRNIGKELVNIIPDEALKGFAHTPQPNLVRALLKSQLNQSELTLDINFKNINKTKVKPIPPEVITTAIDLDKNTKKPSSLNNKQLTVKDSDNTPSTATLAQLPDQLLTKLPELMEADK